MTTFVLPLEIIGLVLTAAMIGAVIIALKEEKK
jgi:NADH:ubiquinone oxidoreductase subunit 6 (subunit J)